MITAMCQDCGEILTESNDVTPCEHHTKNQIQQILNIMRVKEVELPLPENKKLPKDMECPTCYAKIKRPKYFCKVCHSQVIFVEEQ